jgi:hypothetical protein
MLNKIKRKKRNSERMKGPLVEQGSQERGTDTQINESTKDSKENLPRKAESAWSVSWPGILCFSSCARSNATHAASNCNKEEFKLSKFATWSLVTTATNCNKEVFKLFKFVTWSTPRQTATRRCLSLLHLQQGQHHVKLQQGGV